MQAWMIRSAPAARLPAAAAAAIVEGIGRDCFARQVLAAVRPLLPVTHCVAIAIDAADAVPLGYASLDGEVARAAGTHYIRHGYYRQDNNLRLLERHARDFAPGRALLSRQSPADVFDADHRRTCYERLGIVERLSLVCPRESGRPLFLNFYRSRRDGAASARELDTLRALVPLLASAVARHAELAPAPAADHRSTALLATLSAREQAVIEGVCAGLSAKQIARRLGIEPSTVITYRQRAYRHLGIQRQLDLIRLFRH